MKSIVQLPTPALVQDEREAVVAYLVRQADGCDGRAVDLEARGEVVMAQSLRAMARTLIVLADRIECGAHRNG